MKKYFLNYWKKILKFVNEQLNNKSPKARKKAKEFLKKWEK